MRGRIPGRAGTTQPMSIASKRIAPELSKARQTYGYRYAPGGTTDCTRPSIALSESGDRNDDHEYCHRQYPNPKVAEPGLDVFDHFWVARQP